jgi:hypothetical protein
VDGLPFSQSCENNKRPILGVLREAFADRRQVLEIASGTGQHACYFAEHMPWLKWQPSELAAHLSVLLPRCAAYTGDNLLPPQVLDVTDDPWRAEVPDALFTANSLHIMPGSAVEAMFESLGRLAGDDVVLAIYGPFNYRGRYTSDSNARFDLWLGQQHPASAIRDFERVDDLARAAGFDLDSDRAMPANNRLILWRKSVSAMTPP